MLKLKFLKKLIAAFCAAAIVGTASVPTVGAFGVTNHCLNSGIIVMDLFRRRFTVDENIDCIVENLACIKEVTNKIVNIVSKQAKNLEQIQKFKEVQSKILEEVKKFDEIQDVDDPYHLLQIREKIQNILDMLEDMVSYEESYNSNNISDEEEKIKRFCSIENRLSRLLKETPEIISEEIEKKFQQNNAQETTKELKKLSKLLDEHVNSTENYLQKATVFFQCIFEKIYVFKPEEQKKLDIFDISIYNVIYRPSCEKWKEEQFKKVESEIWAHLDDLKCVCLNLKNIRDNIKTVNNGVRRKYLYKHNIMFAKDEITRLINKHRELFEKINGTYANIIGVADVSVLDLFEPGNTIFNNCNFDEMRKYAIY